MHIAYNTEMFRQHPKLGIGLGAILLGIGFFGYAAEYRDYRKIDKAPQEMSFEQAVTAAEAAGDAPRWVRLPAGLQPNCDQILQETSNGSVNHTSILASDPSQERWFWVELRGQVACRAASMALEGTLRKADPGLPAWLKDRGVVVPASSYPLMVLAAGEGPGDLVLLLWIFAGMIVGGLIAILAFARMLSARTHSPLSRGAGVGSR